MVRQHLGELAHACREQATTDAGRIMLASHLGILAKTFSRKADNNGGLRVLKKSEWNGETGTHLDEWLPDDRLRYWLNHEARGHMSSDLRRYVYAAVFAHVRKGSPKGHQDFDLPGLEPDHKNWKPGSSVTDSAYREPAFRPQPLPATSQRTGTISSTTTRLSVAA